MCEDVLSPRGICPSLLHGAAVLTVVLGAFEGPWKGSYCKRKWGAGLQKSENRVSPWFSWRQLLSVHLGCWNVPHNPDWAEGAAFEHKQACRAVEKNGCVVGRGVGPSGPPGTGRSGRHISGGRTLWRRWTEWWDTRMLWRWDRRVVETIVLCGRNRRAKGGWRILWPSSGREGTWWLTCGWGHCLWRERACCLHDICRLLWARSMLCVSLCRCCLLWKSLQSRCWTWTRIIRNELAWQRGYCHADIWVCMEKPGEEKACDMRCTCETAYGAVVSKNAMTFLSSCSKDLNLFEMERHLTVVECSKKYGGDCTGWMWKHGWLDVRRGRGFDDEVKFLQVVIRSFTAWRFGNGCVVEI